MYPLDGLKFEDRSKILNDDSYPLHALIAHRSSLWLQIVIFAGKTRNTGILSLYLSRYPQLAYVKGINTPYQHTLSLDISNPSYQSTLSTTPSIHPLNPPTKHTLSTHPSNTPYQPADQPTLLTHPLNTPPQPIPSTYHINSKTREVSLYWTCSRIRTK